MSTALDLREKAAVLTLDTEESARLAGVAQELCGQADGLLDSPEWLAAARNAWEETPLALRRTVRAHRRDSGAQGTLLLRGLPLGAAPIPDTPSVHNSVQRQVTCPAAVLMLVATGLGDPVAFAKEKHGALVQDVVPVPGKETSQSNAGSVPLMFHSENAFHPHRPDHVLLNCLRGDREGVAGLRTVSVRILLGHLDTESRAALSAPEFRTVPPPSFGPAAESDCLPHGVLSGSPDDPEIRVDLVATRPLTPRAEAAFTALRSHCEEAAHTVRLTPGDLVVLDNRTTLHGRSAFHAHYDGRDRWLQRAFVLADLRRSRRYRPRDGHVLSS